MSGTLEPFNVLVDKWVDKAKGNAQKVFEGTVADIVARLKELTPVRTGYLRANWIVTTDSSVEPIKSQNGEDGLDFSIGDLALGARAIIANPVVYARRVNYGFVGPDSLGRHYNQPGVHMVEQVITEIPQIVANNIQKLNS